METKKYVHFPLKKIRGQVKKTSITTLSRKRQESLQLLVLRVTLHTYIAVINLNLVKHLNEKEN